MTKARSRAAGLFIAAAVSVPLTFAFAGPAGAGEGFCDPEFPDADGEMPSGGFEEYNLDGDQQSEFEFLEPGEIANTAMRYWNQTHDVQDIVLRSDLDLEPPNGFVVKVFRGNREITDKIFGLSGKAFRDVEAGTTTPELRIRVKMKASADEDATIAIFTTGAYSVADFCGDTVATFAGDLTK